MNGVSLYLHETPQSRRGFIVFPRFIRGRVFVGFYRPLFFLKAMVHDKTNKKIYLTKDVSAGELLDLITTIPDLHRYTICRNLPLEYSTDAVGEWVITQG